MVQPLVLNKLIKRAKIKVEGREKKKKKKMYSTWPHWEEGKRSREFTKSTFGPPSLPGHSVTSHTIELSVLELQAYPVRW